MNNNKLIVSYQKNWGEDGTVYTQTVKVPSELLTIINTKINKAIKEKSHPTIEDNHRHIFLSPLFLSPLQGKKNYTTNTTSKLIKQELENLGVDTTRYLSDRNTIVEFY